MPAQPHEPIAEPTETPVLVTERLRLAPLEPSSARSMVRVLADPGLYRFTGGRPPSEPELRRRYQRWAAGPGRPGERWCNWRIETLRPVEPVGHLQATITAGADGAAADLAWVVGVAWQGRGYATEAARAVAGWLVAMGVHGLSASIQPDNVASARVAAALGLSPTDAVTDGEVIWRARELTRTVSEEHRAPRGRRPRGRLLECP